MPNNENKPKKNKDPLHGVTLEMMVTRLQEAYGWEELGRQVRINCFNHEPSIKSSLKFLRKTPWAKEKVESFYLYSLRKKRIVQLKDHTP
ncbi:MAG: DUF2132 domain-containing protein [Desulfobulbaceae bacterium]|nr:DUF2132 domain-containing protein [Desulfobulbaceae bacterium]